MIGWDAVYVHGGPQQTAWTLFPTETTVSIAHMVSFLSELGFGGLFGFLGLRRAADTGALECVLHEFLSELQFSGCLAAAKCPEEGVGGVQIRAGL